MPHTHLSASGPRPAQPHTPQPLPERREPAPHRGAGAPTAPGPADESNPDRPQPRRASWRRAVPLAVVVTGLLTLRSLGSLRRPQSVSSRGPEKAIETPFGGLSTVVSSPHGSSAGGAVSAQHIASLRQKLPLNPIRLDGDPYRNEDAVDLQAWASSYCGVRFLEPEGTQYLLGTFASREGARAASYHITHRSACGTCSTLQDLATYLERPDLTTPVRRCTARVPAEALLSRVFGRDDALGAMNCLRRLGFSEDCARTWYDNARHTAEKCFWPCVTSWLKREPNNRPDGSLNDCLQCDEDESGPVFKITAGRTRRNSGIVSAIGRPLSQIDDVDHDAYGASGASRAPLDGPARQKRH